MSTSEHNNDCFCGQPLEIVAPASSTSCRRCGRIVTRSHRDGGVWSSGLVAATPILAVLRAA